MTAREPHAARCPNARLHLTERIIADGRVQYYSQCLECGRAGNPWSHADALDTQPVESLPAFDERAARDDWHRCPWRDGQ